VLEKDSGTNYKKDKENEEWRNIMILEQIRRRIERLMNNYVPTIYCNKS
jgi:hypothetical protein